MTEIKIKIEELNLKLQHNEKELRKLIEDRKKQFAIEAEKFTVDENADPPDFLDPPTKDSWYMGKLYPRFIKRAKTPEEREGYVKQLSEIKEYIKRKMFIVTPGQLSEVVNDAKEKIDLCTARVDEKIKIIQDEELAKSISLPLSGQISPTMINSFISDWAIKQADDPRGLYDLSITAEDEVGISKLIEGVTNSDTTAEVKNRVRKGFTNLIPVCREYVKECRAEDIPDHIITEGLNEFITKNKELIIYNAIRGTPLRTFDIWGKGLLNVEASGNKALIESQVLSERAIQEVSTPIDGAIASLKSLVADLQGNNGKITPRRVAAIAENIGSLERSLERSISCIEKLHTDLSKQKFYANSQYAASVKKNITLLRKEVVSLKADERISTANLQAMINTLKAIKAVLVEYHNTKMYAFIKKIGRGEDSVEAKHEVDAINLNKITAVQLASTITMVKKAVPWWIRSKIKAIEKESQPPAENPRGPSMH